VEVKRKTMAIDLITFHLGTMLMPNIRDLQSPIPYQLSRVVKWITVDTRVPIYMIFHITEAVEETYKGRRYFGLSRIVILDI
jgi:hypothetical protein